MKLAGLPSLSALVAISLVAALVCSAPSNPLLAQAEAQVASVAAKGSPALTTEQIEAFLLNASILSSRKIGKGVTGSSVATLSDGRLTHDAHIQHVNIEKPSERGFKDHFRYNIAAYRLARHLGLANVPVSVERQVDEAQAAVTWWVDDVMMDEEKRREREKKNTMPAEWRPTRTVGYIHVMRVFDELIANADRNAGNSLWTSDGTMWMINHTRAFRLQRRLKKPQVLERCDRALWKALPGLTVESVTTVVGGSLTKDEIDALIARRNLIVKHFDAMIAKRGEVSVLYTLMQ